MFPIILLYSLTNSSSNEAFVVCIINRRYNLSVYNNKYGFEKKK